MKVLLVSERFAPGVGGIQTVSRLLGGALGGYGHKVTVLTRERGPKEARHGFRLLRCPGLVQLLREYRTADRVILQGPTIRLGWPLLWLPKRAVMVHHMAPGASSTGPRFWLREHLARRTHHAAVSKALAPVIPWPVEAILADPYDDAVFRVESTVPRDLDVAFAGRLVAEKGAHLLIQALGISRGRGVTLRTSIIGEGPESRRLLQHITERGLQGCVTMRGLVTGPELAHLLNRHRVLVVPSLCWEGFGLVSVEAIACGCVVVGSRIGGLPEAIGPCGTTFRAGNAESLAQALRDIFRERDQHRTFRAGAEQHLAKHRPTAVAKQYLEFMDVRSEMRRAAAIDSGPAEEGTGAVKCALS